MRKTKKIKYYSSGLISILLLPIFCILFLKNTDAFQEYRAIDLAMPDKIWEKDNAEESQYINSYLNSKKYSIVNLTGDKESDEVKLKIASENVKKIILTKDSINGIKFHFSKTAQYLSFIRVLDIMADNKVSFYFLRNNTMWFTNIQLRPFVNSKKQKMPERMNCDTQYMNQKIDEQKVENFDVKYDEVFFKKYFMPIIAYLLMVVFVLRKYFFTFYSL